MMPSVSLRRKALLALVVTALLVVGSAKGQTIDWCDSTADAAASGSVYEAYYGTETCIPLCVKKSADTTYNGLLAIEKVETESPGVYPTGDTFKFPHDQINFPASASLKPVTGYADTDPFKRNFCFTPQHGEECAYTVCFKGQDTESSSSATSVRCYKIEVYNSALEFTGSEEASVDDLSKEVGPKDGFTMGAWVYPKCTATGNQTVMYFGSNRNIATSLGTDSGLEVRNAIKYSTDATTGESTFMYYDHFMGPVYATNKYCCDKWHYVGVSVSSDNSAFLFVDGAVAKSQVTGSRNTIKYDVKTFSTASRPDNNLDGDGQGTFKVGHFTGEGFKGLIDEVSVFDKALTPTEMHTNMEKRDLTGSANLKGYFTMTGSFPLSNAAGTSTMTASVGTPAIVKKAIPTMIPCVLGLQHSVGPSDGSCPTDVYGWSMSDGLAPACSFGGRVIQGTYVDDKTIKCETPGHVSPRYVNVLASNDAGTQFTSSSVGKEVKHLYMESSLYVDGQGGGAEADSVCKDLPTRAVTFGGWFCPKCGPPAS